MKITLLFHVGHEISTWRAVDGAAVIRVTEAASHSVRRYNQASRIRFLGDPPGLLSEPDRIGNGWPGGRFPRRAEDLRYLTGLEVGVPVPAMASKRQRSNAYPGRQSRIGRPVGGAFHPD